MPKNKAHSFVDDEDADKQTIRNVDIMNSGYHHSLRVINEYENGIKHVDYFYLRNAKMIVSRAESSIEMLPDKMKLIMQAEFIESKRGSKWYLEYFTPPTYYRIRKKAYRMFEILMNR